MKKGNRKNISEKRRAEILEAFYRCIRKYGLHKASNRKLADEAGIQLSSLHHYFKNRDEIIEELIKRVIEEDVVRGRDSVNQYNSSRKRLDRIINYAFDPDMVVGRHKGVFYDFWSEAFRNKRIRETLRNEIRFRREEAMKYLKESGIAQGVSSAEAKEIANLVLALHEGAEYLWNMDPENVSLKRIANLTKRFIEVCAAETHSRKSEE